MSDQRQLTPDEDAARPLRTAAARRVTGPNSCGPTQDSCDSEVAGGMFTKCGRCPDFHSDISRVFLFSEPAVTLHGIFHFLELLGYFNQFDLRRPWGRMVFVNSKAR